MRFEYAGKQYRIAFKHDPSRKWEDHAGHNVSLIHDKGHPAELVCHFCGLRLSHIPKADQVRKTTCTIYEVVAGSAGPVTTHGFRPMLTGVARPNPRTLVKVLERPIGILTNDGEHKTYSVGKFASMREQDAKTFARLGKVEIVVLADRYERAKGRHTALANALEFDCSAVDANNYYPLIVADRGFRAAAWQAFYSRSKKTEKTLNLYPYIARAIIDKELTAK